MVLIHAMSPPLGSRLARSLEAAGSAGLRPLVGPFARPIARLSGPPDMLDEAGHGLPEGAAKPEALAVRLRRRGAELSWGEPDILPSTVAYVEACRARGASSVELVRADPSLLTELELGGFFNVYWPSRWMRRALRSAPSPLLSLLSSAAVADAAFWAGVRDAATDEEWRRLVGSSYVVLMYHRLAGDRLPGQERLDVDPAMFRRQLGWLRRLGFRPLSSRELTEFHTSPTATLPKRRYVLTDDDGFKDAVEAIREHIAVAPQLFVNTALVGGLSSWAGDRPLASWEELRALAAAGAAIGSHARRHDPLAGLPPERLDEELAGSLVELRGQVPSAIPVLAYPHGSHDEHVCAAAARAGYRAAFTTEMGRNGAGTDVYCLRRVSVKDWDGPISLTWKALTGEVVPPAWDRWARRLRRLRRTVR